MATYLKIENPGVCPIEGFILLGATSKRLADNDSPYSHRAIRSRAISTLSTSCCGPSSSRSSSAATTASNSGPSPAR